MALEFPQDYFGHTTDRSAIWFAAKDGARLVTGNATRAALEALAGHPLDDSAMTRAFEQHRERFEAIVQAKYDAGGIEPDGKTVVVAKGDL